MILKNITKELESGLTELFQEYRSKLTVSWNMRHSKDEFDADLVDFYIYCYNKKHKIYKQYNDFIIELFSEIERYLYKPDQSNLDYDAITRFNNKVRIIDNYIFFFINKIGLDEFRKNKLLFRLANSINTSKIWLGDRHRGRGNDSISNFVGTLSIFQTEESCFATLKNIIHKSVSGYWYSEDSSLYGVMTSCNLKNEERFISYVTDRIKSNASWELRRDLYKGIILSGALTKDLARKMRSDQSEKASLSAIKCLISNKHLYENYSDLVSKFCDSNYHDVAMFLATNLEKNLLMNMLGNKMYNVKSIVSKRMTEEL